MELRATVQGVPLVLRIPRKKVFVPNLVGLLNAATMRVAEGDVVFDASTGSGVHAILAAKLGARRVIACDVSPDAIAAARLNARLNGVAGRCRFILGSFAEALERVRDVDLVVSTLPNTPLGHPGSREPAMRAAPLVSRYLSGGAGGASLTAELARKAIPRLSGAGRLHLHLVEWNDNEPLLAALREGGLAVRTLTRARIPAWGLRCNAAGAFERKALRNPWVIRYAELGGRGQSVRVIEAARRPAAARRAAAQVVVWVSR